jgi:hypothetical protein
MAAKHFTAMRGWLTTRRLVEAGLAGVAAVVVAVLILAQQGQLWSGVSVEDSHAGYLLSISCADDGVCMGVGQDYQVLTNLGAEGSWTLADPLPGHGGAQDAIGVACFDGGCLVGTDAALYETTSMGSRWKLVWSGTPSWQLGHPTCTRSGSFCMDFGNAYDDRAGEREAIVTITNSVGIGGSKPTVKVSYWTKYLRMMEGIVSASCPTPSICEGVDPNGLFRTTDGGSHWHLQLSSASSNGAGWGIGACPSVSTCIVGGGSANFAYTHDGGASWHLVSTPWTYVAGGFLAQGSVTGISCDTGSHCLAAISESVDPAHSGFVLKPLMGVHPGKSSNFRRLRTSGDSRVHKTWAAGPEVARTTS